MMYGGVKSCCSNSNDYATTSIIRLTARQFNFLQVLGGCISGPDKLVSAVRTLHHILGGAINPVSRLD